MKEQVARDFTTFLSFKLGVYMGQDLYKNYPENFNELIPKLAQELLNQILNLFKAEVDKLTVIDDGELDKVFYKTYIPRGVHKKSMEIAQSQLQDTKKQLLEALEEGWIIKEDNNE